MKIMTLVAVLAMSMGAMACKDSNKTTDVPAVDAVTDVQADDVADVQADVTPDVVVDDVPVGDNPVEDVPVPTDIPVVEDAADVPAVDPGPPVPAK